MFNPNIIVFTMNINFSIILNYCLLNKVKALKPQFFNQKWPFFKIACSCISIICIFLIFL